MSALSETFPCLNSAAAWRAGDRVYVDHETQRVTPQAIVPTSNPSQPRNLPLIGVCANAATPEDFTVDVRIPIGEPQDLRSVQVLQTGRQTADGRQIVVPFMTHKRVKQTDRPDLDRHPVLFMLECEAAAARGDLPVQKPAAVDATSPADPPPQNPAAPADAATL